MTKRLDIAIRELQQLPEDQQDELAAYILEELEMREDVAAYDAAKAEGGEEIPFEDAIREIEAKWKKDKVRA